MVRILNQLVTNGRLLFLETSTGGEEGDPIVRIMGEIMCNWEGNLPRIRIRARNPEGFLGWLGKKKKLSGGIRNALN